MTDPVLRVDGLVHRYGSRTVLDGVSLDVHAGEVVAVIGPSGAGKTTLFRGITRLVRPLAGEISVAGRRLSSSNGADLRATRREIALIFQQFNLVRRLSALDNVLAGHLADLPTWRVLLRRPGRAVRAHALGCLAEVGLAELAAVRADRLSGGQQQRVAIARALAQRSRVILADEPVSNLDPASAAAVLRALRTVAREDGIAVLCNLHQVELLDGFADRVIGLRAGRIVTDVPAAEFGARHRDAVYATAPTANANGKASP
jgi:phosphonate transport system ATP-binding protein